jgi:hypothetical protein
MTEPTGPALAPAGWYPTAAGSPTLRWWDGTQWTNHEHTIVPAQVPGAQPQYGQQQFGQQPYAAQQYGQPQYGQQLTTPAGTRPNTVWIWIFSILPLVQLAQLPLLISFYAKIEAAGLRNTSAISQIELNPASGFLALEGLSLVVYAIGVVLAALDYRALKLRGVVQPFHWAWTFLAAIVYAIGRGVVVRRRTGSGVAPMWLYLAATLISYIGILFVVFSFVAAVMRDAG